MHKNELNDVKTPSGVVATVVSTLVIIFGVSGSQVSVK